MNTPEHIETLAPNQVFVFGSNLAGRHGAGAAKQALKFGARYGRGIGLYGQTYAIPTKDGQIKTLPLRVIEMYVKAFLIFAAGNPHLQFLVTKIGCGLAGYKIEEIASLFQDRFIPPNVVLPREFK